MLDENASALTISRLVLLEKVEEEENNIQIMNIRDPPRLANKSITGVVVDWRCQLVNFCY